MSRTFIKVTTRGVVTRPPMLRRMPDGKPVTTVGVEVQKQNGDIIYQDWDVFERDAEDCARLLRRGDLVEFSGSETKNQWADKQSGQTRTRIVKRAREVTFFNHEPPEDKTAYLFDSPRPSDFGG